MFPILIRESRNPGIMHARFVSLGKSFKVKFAAPLEYEYWPFVTFSVIVGALILTLATVALGVTKVLVVPESSITDSYLILGKLQHKSFECASRMLELKIFFTLTHLTVLHSMLCFSTCQRCATGAQKPCSS